MRIADEDNTKREKAKNLRYKKPIVKDLNLESLRSQLYDIQEECENVHWFFDDENETLINALDGNEDEAYEFRMMFGDLCAECNKMLADLAEEWIPACFDKFFVAAGAGNDYGGLLGYDSYENDYYGLSCLDAFAEDEAKKSLKQMTKDDLIAAIRQCFRVYQSFIALQYRYDCLKAAIDVLKDENTAYLQMVTLINQLYDEADKEQFYEYKKEAATTKLNEFIKNLPQEVWLQ